MEKIGLKIDKYYASEIDKDAISIAKASHGESIIHLDRVEDITLEKVISKHTFIARLNPF